MSVTVIQKDQGSAGIIGKASEGWKLVAGQLVIDTETVAEGGVEMDLSEVFPRELISVHIDSQDGIIASYDYANKKVKLWQADYDAEADGVLIELTGSVTVTLRWFAIGI